MFEEKNIVENLNSKRPWNDMVVAVVAVGVCDFNRGAASFCHGQLTLPILSYCSLTSHDDVVVCVASMRNLDSIKELRWKEAIYFKSTKQS